MVSMERLCLAKEIIISQAIKTTTKGDESKWIDSKGF
jgi:hypothetical protein